MSEKEAEEQKKLEEAILREAEEAAKKALKEDTPGTWGGDTGQSAEELHDEILDSDS